MQTKTTAPTPSGRGLSEEIEMIATIRTTTASSGIADRLEALDAHIVRGAGVVAGLGADLERRDAEVALLRGQIDADRALLSGMD